MSTVITFTGTATEVICEMHALLGGISTGGGLQVQLATTLGKVEQPAASPAKADKPKADPKPEANSKPATTVPKTDPTATGNVKALTDADCRNAWIAKKDAGGTGTHLAACLKPFFPDGTAKPSITALPAEHYQAFIDAVNAIVL